MKITFISPYPNISAFGIRTMSSYLKTKGIQTQLLFMPDQSPVTVDNNGSVYPAHILHEMSELCRDTDLVGITLMTNYFYSAVELTRKLKKDIGIPIIWGGVHPTFRPEECLQFADMVCIGEGEVPILSLIQCLGTNKEPNGIPGVWVRNTESTRRTVQPAQLVQNLDEFPPPDYSMEDHHIIINDHLKPLTNDNIQQFLLPFHELKVVGYQTLTGRGCPHRCAYCFNDVAKNLYKNQRYVRWRSVPHIINELRSVKEQMPCIGFVWLADDAFFARSLNDIADFCIQYKKHIGIPFSCLASPLTISEEKMDLLTDVGMVNIQMGVESGSKRTQKLYKRANMSNDRMIQAMRIINKYRGKIYPPNYDFIVDNPYETDTDKRDTLKFIAAMPRPFKLQAFSLTFYPGTALYQKAKEDGLIIDEQKQIYRHKTWAMKKRDYANLLITLTQNGRFPSWMLFGLASPSVYAMLNARVFKPLIGLVFMALHAVRRTKRLFT